MSQNPTGIGAPLRRTEDMRLVTGAGAYVSDFQPGNLAHAAFVRSPHAHAEIEGVDTAAALAAPGVLAVLTGADAKADGLQAIPHNPDWTGPPDADLILPEGFEVYLSDNHPLPADRARYVGEAIAVVIAETAAAAIAGAELVEVDYAPLPALVDSLKALEAGAPSLWPDRPNNLSLACSVGDAAATEQAFRDAAHVVKFESRINRITGAPMEPKAAIGEYHAAADHYTLRAASGRGVVQTRDRLAAVLGVPAEKCRAVFGDMGGNFGTRNAFSPEFAVMPWASKRVGRPVKWVGNRSECFLSDYQGRDLAVRAEMALDKDGGILAMRGENVLNLGAYSVYFWPLRKGLSMMQGVYDVPVMHFQGKAAFTNTPPIAVYRSAGRPEAIYVVERLLELASLEFGFDRVDIRRRNLVQPDAMPFTNAVGVTYDNGDYPKAMADVLDVADWTGFQTRKADSATRGLKRGIAVANYLEVTSGIPRERAELRFNPDRTIDLVVGTMSSGQGHETSFPQLISDWLGAPFDRIRFIANDTDRVTVGGGSHSGRSMRLVSIAAHDAVEVVKAKARAIASHVLETPADALTFDAFAFHDQSGRQFDLWQAAEASMTLNSLPEDLRGGLEGIGDITNRAGGYPYGAHVCEVEVDAETGFVRIVNWAGVDDVGVAVNPLILHGQAHGAIAQGFGQALLEDVAFDPETAQLLAGSFMDYAMPRADNTPPMETRLMEVPAASHPHGVRPGGEGGTTPALALVVNAIVDALKDEGVRHIEMPTTPQRVWQAIQKARATG